MRFALPLAFLGLVAVAPAQFALRDGDRVAFYGDSITDNGPYTGLIETYVLTRYPNWNIRFFNAGVGGDRVSGGWMGSIDERLPRDLFSRRPTVVTVMLGMNDGGYVPFDDKIFSTYDTGYRHILDQFRTEIPKARVWLIKPSPFDDVTREPGIPGGYNSVLLRYANDVGELAKQYGHWSVDFNFPVADALFRAKAENPTLATKILPDRVHPSYAGHLIMAASLLSAWKADSLATEVGIDAPSGAIATKHSKVSKLQVKDSITWSQMDEWLPFPTNRFDPQIALVFSTAPVVSQVLGSQTLRITGLKGASYDLMIDGAKSGTYSAAELASGVDLTKVKTPMNQQAAELEILTQRRRELTYYLWRQVEVGLQKLPSKSRDEALAAMGRLEDDIIRRQHEMAKPKRHEFELKPVG